VTEPAGIQTCNSWGSEDTRPSPRRQGPRFPSASLCSPLTRESRAPSQAWVSNPHPTTSLASTHRQGNRPRAPTCRCAGTGGAAGMALLALGLEKSREGSSAPGHPGLPGSARAADVQPSSGFSACPRKRKRRRKRKGTGQQHPHLEGVIYLRGGRTREGWTRPPCHKGARYVQENQPREEGTDLMVNRS